MTHKMELFDQSTFKKLSRPIPMSIGDDSKVFATGKGTIHLMFNVDGKRKEVKLKNLFYLPGLKVTPLSVPQSARLPRSKFVLDDNAFNNIDKKSGKLSVC